MPPDDLKSAFLQAPTSQMDASIKTLIRAWDDPPTALQTLQVLDQCVRGGSASGFVVHALEIILKAAIEREDTTREAVVERAFWRHSHG